MLGSTFLKSLRDLSRPMLWWSLGLVSYALIIVLIYPSFRDGPQLDEFLGEEGSILRAFAGNVSDFNSPEGFLTAEMLSFTFPMLFIVFGLWLGTSWLAGEERRGVLEVLLSHPVRRTTILLEKFAAVVAATAMLGFIALVATIAGILIIDMEISLLNVAQAYGSLVMLGSTFAALAVFIAAWTGRTGASIGVGGAVGVLAYVANSFAPLVDAIEWARYLSPIYYFIGADPLTNGLNAVHAAVLIAASAILVALASYLFENRDIGV